MPATTSCRSFSTRSTGSLPEPLKEWRLTSPREAALRILAGRLQTPIDVVTTVPLAAFQQEAFERATAILRRRRGVLIADSVGLGKTFVALALIESALKAGQHVIVVVPAGLKRMWRSELRKLASSIDGWTLMSHTALALRPPVQPAFDLVVVDESHAFRNPRTRRFRALRSVCRGAQVVLVTATPVNNSLADLYFQLRLFCADGAFRDIGIGSLRATMIDGNPLRDAEFARLRRAVMVRRTRAAIRATGAAGLSFPTQVVTVPVAYQLPVSTEHLGRWLRQLTFIAYRLDGEVHFAPEMLRFGLLKRMESSVAAIRATLRRQIRYYEQLVDAMAHGMILRPRTFRSLYQPTEDSIQLVIEPVALEKRRGGFTKGDAEAARAELITLREWHTSLSPEDEKLRVLVDVVKARPPSARTIVFTEYRDTASYIWRALRRRFAVGLIDGSGAWIGDTPASRRQVIERFAPQANHARVHEREAVRVLVATDVLAEGMNLQDADAVISYDLPWNPIRLIQRAGRVDRIGSPHDVVTVYNFIPDREFDALLGLARTIRGKLKTVRSAVGLDGPVLEPDPVFDSIMEGIRAGDPSVLDRIEPADTPLEDEVQQQIEALAPVCWTPVAALPGTSGSKILIALKCGADHRDVVVAFGTGGELADSPDRILAHGLAQETCGCLPAGVLELAERVAARVPDQETDRRSVAGQVARLVRRSLRELQLNASPEIYDVADEVLAGLGNVTDADVEFELARLLRRHWPALSELLSAVQKALAASGNRVSAIKPWRVAGVIVAD